MVLETPSFINEVTTGQLITIAGYIAAIALAWGNLKTKMENLGEWKHEHELDAQARNNAITKLDGVIIEIRQIEKDSSRRLQIMEDWVREHAEWAREKSEHMVKLSEAVVYLRTYCEESQRRLGNVENRINDTHNRRQKD